LHQVLGEVLGEPPANLILDRTPQGKPALRDHPHLHINLSHSRGAALIGWGPQPVGVDLEAQGRVLRDGIAARILHPAERAIWSALAPADRDAWLLQIWVRKEAVAKADGRGIALGLARIDQTNAAVALPGGGHWTLADLPLPAGWVGAMAVAASPPA
jgi:4'-phosphopantetheinyl transferase